MDSIGRSRVALRVPKAYLVDGGKEVLVTHGEGLLALWDLHTLWVEVDKLGLWGASSLSTCLGNAIKGDKALA